MMKYERNTLCLHYSECLDLAARKKMARKDHFTCEGCERLLLPAPEKDTFLDVVSHRQVTHNVTRNMEAI